MPVRNCMVPDKIASRTRPFALRVAEIIEGVVIPLVCAIENEHLALLDHGGISGILLRFDDDKIRHAHALERSARQAGIVPTFGNDVERELRSRRHSACPRMFPTRLTDTR